jgi:hypothetical protein
MCYGSVVLQGQQCEENVVILKSLMRKAAETGDYELRQSYMQTFADELQRMLKTPNSLTCRFDSVPHLKTLTSADGDVRVFSWGYEVERRKYAYCAVVQRRMGSGKSPLTDVYLLNDVKNNLTLPEKEVLHCPDWYGCLYYEMSEKQYDNKTYYLLMGFDYNDGLSYKKHIETLSFNPQGQPVFGMPIFIDEGGAKCRVIFEYSAQSGMHLNYNHAHDKITFNWLHPIIPEMSRERSAYVSDLTYDGYEFRYGKWMKVSDLIIKKPMR